MSRKLSMIVAMGEGGEIGCRGGLPWGKLGSDMRRFRELTMAVGAVVMGRKTWDSLPLFSRPLKGRCNFVATRDPASLIENYLHESRQAGIGGVGVSLFREVAPIADLALLPTIAAARPLAVIGGRQLYEWALPLADVIYLTAVPGTWPGADVRMPEMLEEFRRSWDWAETDYHARGLSRASTPEDVRFYTLTRKPT